MDVQNRDAIDFIENIEFPDDFELKTEIKQEGECGTDNMKYETIIRPKLEPREAFGQSEIKDERTSDLEVKDIKKEIEEFDVMNKNVKIESKDGEREMLEFVKNIEFSDDVKPKIEVKDEPREALKSGQSEIKGEPTSDLEVKDIKKEIKEFDVMNKNVKNESKDGERAILEFVENIEFSADVKPISEIKDELIEPKKEIDKEFQNGISELEKMDDLDFNGETFINDSIPQPGPQQNLASTSGFENSHVDVKTQDTKKHPICPTKFGKKSNLKVIITTVHGGNKVHKCPTSSATFGQRKGQKYHISFVDNRIKPNECQTCFAEFDEKDQLRKHISAVHDGIKKPYKCSICDLNYVCKSTLSQHIASVHEGKKPHNCPMCEKSFSLKFHMIRHIESVHKGKKPHKCPECEKSFSQKSHLIGHIKSVHKDKAPHKCPICEKSFSLKRDLIRHLKSVHEGKRPNKCTICEATFSEYYDLKKHISAVHVGKKPHNCSTCEKSFSRKSHLRTHIESVHQGKKPHKCSTCEKSFSRKSHLSRHIKSVHEDKKTQK